jgi:hypothetical protein
MYINSRSYKYTLGPVIEVSSFYEGQQSSVSPHVKAETNSVCETMCFLLIRNYARWATSTNPDYGLENNSKHSPEASVL